MICKLAVETDKKQFVEVKHYEKDNIILSKGYYHVKCYKDRLNGSDKLNKIQLAALSFINGAKKKAGIEDEEVITV